MNERDAKALVDATPLPDGFRLVVEPLRRFKYRNLWAVRLVWEDEVVQARRYYNVAAGVVQAQAVAWAMSRETANP